MKMNVEFESREELLSFVGMFGAAKELVTSKGQAVLVEDKDKNKAEDKHAAEKTKKDKAETKKEEKSKVQDKKEVAVNVEAEETGVDETPTGQIKDAEVTEENKEAEAKITKEMVRAICSKAIKAGKSAEVKNIVSKYGASKLPDLKEECYADAYKDVEALL
ncbi:hypothetical protein [Clostridium beijerinckii]|uniref:Ribosomal protein L9 n=1 Tax=Clostridium beijerinckii TaxID=1520 RepID=A0AAX0AZ55_CLOBE|nr:hypothetical protein [Clostridium beijerinckii]NRT88131.1 ribosomal protein L9 [Clostridium beijerinckii]NYC73559.1 ribosomal protein L9 [Clostridium beijerinckii]